MCEGVLQGKRVPRGIYNVSEYLQRIRTTRTPWQPSNFGSRFSDVFRLDFGPGFLTVVQIFGLIHCTLPRFALGQEKIGKMGTRLGRFPNYEAAHF